MMRVCIYIYIFIYIFIYIYIYLYIYLYIYIAAATGEEEAAELLGTAGQAINDTTIIYHSNILHY